MICGYDKSMKRKIAVSVPAELVQIAEEQVEAGNASSVSAYVTAALEEKARHDRLADLLDEMDQILGPPSKRDRAWARRVLGA
jgi:Arc/MetJ-type ribon-helix-helix transcriptional regulator